MYLPINYIFYFQNLKGITIISGLLYYVTYWNPF